MISEGAQAAGKLAFVVTEDWYFWSHRLPSARAAQAAGNDVVLIARLGEFAERIRATGIQVVEWPVRRGSLNLWTELKSVVALYRILRAVRPDIVHNVALKPVIYGTLAAKVAGVPAIINSITGFGFLFASSSIVSSVSGRVMLFVLRRLVRLPRVLTICQNQDDADLLWPVGPMPDTLRLIKGSGVDAKRFAPSPEPEGAPVAAFVGRMLWEKGVGELVEASAILQRRGVALRVLLVGPVDRQNPGAIGEDVLRRWQDAGLVAWMGGNDDVAALWRQVHIAVLPSYREGLPKAVLEAAACGRAIVTTDVPGCRDIVEDGINGLLVPARAPPALADALDRLASSADLRKRLGTAARAKVVAEFADEIVAAQISTVYRDALRWVSSSIAPRKGLARLCEVLRSILLLGSVLLILAGGK